MRIHKEMGTILGGVHLELTGEVNEDGFSVVSRLLIGRTSLSELNCTVTDGVYWRIDGAGRQGSILQLPDAL